MADRNNEQPNVEMSDQELNSFLKLNRPLPPRSCKDEKESIWQAISHNIVYQTANDSKAGYLGQMAFSRVSQFALGGVMVAMSGIILWTQSSSSPAFTDINQETAFVEQTLSFEFVDNGDGYEDSDLALLAE